MQQSPQFNENGKDSWSGRVDSNHRPPGPEPDNVSSSKLLKKRRFQALHDKTVLLKLVEIDCTVWDFGALVDYKMIYTRSTLRLPAENAS
jgi:hypothetical protein